MYDVQLHRVVASRKELLNSFFFVLSKCHAVQELVGILATILVDIYVLLPSLQKGAVVLLQGSGQRML